MRPRDQRGFVLPTPVMLLSGLAVTAAAVAWGTTRHPVPTEHLVTPSAQHSTPREHHTQQATMPHRDREKPVKPALDRSAVLVEVYNNSQVSGLAGQVATRAAHLGWQVVGSDNWYGTIPASTVYYPARLEKAGRQLALDLGIHRIMPAVAPMRLDRLTVILTGPLASAG
jgi:LytR cell envelope-related transcriptional attenuator